jgi:hypothetical protein
VRSVAVAAVVSAALTLAWIERSRRRWTVAPPRGAAVLSLSLLAGAVAAAVVVLQAHHDPRPPEALASGQAYPKIKPPWRDPLGTAPKTAPKPLGTPPPSQTASASPPPSGAKPPPKRAHSSRRNPPPPRHPPHPKTSHPRPSTNPVAAAAHPPRTHVVRHKHASPSRTWLYVLAGVLLLLLVVAGRLLAVRLAWRRLRRRLATGSPADRVTGAWAWMRIRLAAFRLALPAAVSPDVVAAGRAGVELPAEVFAPLQALATATTTAAFAREESVDGPRSDAAWADALRAETSARALLTRRARVLLAFRAPAANVGAR